MSGLNLTGKAQPGDYLLGRGRILAAPILASGKPGAFRDLGNAPNFSVTISTENVEHQSSRAATRITDVDAVLSLKAELSFTLDEMNFQNVADFFLGTSTAAAYTNPAIAGYSAEVLTDSVETGRWYNLENSAGLRPKDIDAGDLTVRRDPSGTPATLTLNTDYEVNTDLGLIFFVVGGAVSDGDEIDVELAAKAGAAASINRMNALVGGVTSYALKFISLDGVVSAKKQEWNFHSVALKPDGEVPLIGDEFATMDFTGVCAASETAFASNPYFNVEDAQA